MQKMSYFSPLLYLLVDLCVVQGIRQGQLSPLLISHPFVVLWGGGVLRCCALLFVTYSYPGTLPWMKTFEGLQTQCVLSFLSPAYITFLWTIGRSAVELLWGWHSWEALLQTYAVVAVSWLYWTRHVPTILSEKKKKPGKENGASLNRLLGYMKDYSWHFTVVITLVIISSLCEMAIPHYTGKMTDWIMNEDKPEAFSEAITIMTVITIGSAVCEFVCDLIYNLTMSKIHTFIQGLVFKSVLKQEIAFFDKSTTGDIVSRITTDTNTMSESLSDKLSLMMWYFWRLVFLFGFMVHLSWKLSLFTFMGLPVIWVIPEISGKFYQKLARDVQASLAKANDVAMETFSAMKTVRSFANEDGETARYQKRLEETYSLNKKEAAAYAVSTWTNSMSSLALKVSILYYGGRLVTGDDVSSGDLVSFVLYELQFTSAVETVMNYYPHVKKAIGASEKIFEYVERTPDMPPDGTEAPEQLKGHVQFQDVTFSYPKRPEHAILKGLSLELRPGRMTALVGPSGGGKSTCVNLLERFYQPEQGSILLDGRPLSCYKDDYLHKKISVVSQEPKLFARSLRENIKYGMEEASEEDMIEAAKSAYAHHFITSMQNGYDTDAGAKGDMVSGGQKQRIAIARALIRKPKILVLDDATSSLDTQSEELVHQALSKLRREQQVSVLLIAHRLSAVEKADHIVFLQQGEVQEEGTHEQLVQRGGLYAEFVKKQNTSIHRNAEEEQEEETAEVSSP